MKYSFSKDFWWGSATSGPQSEGSANKPHQNMLDYWYSIQPEDFFNQVGPQVTSDFYHTYKSDIELYHSIGLNSLRTSIQWSRLIKDLETGEPDEDGIRFYQDVINEFKAKNIRLIFNLHHFDIPIELLEKYGGWESKHVVDLFAKFAKTAFALFGDQVSDWVTFNEPIVIVEASYLMKFHYPFIQDTKRAMQVLYNLNLASAKAIQAFKEEPKCQNSRIGIILNLTPAYPRSNDHGDVQAAMIAELMLNDSFLYPSVYGSFKPELTTLLQKLGLMFEATSEELQIIKNNTIDYLGVNYYQPFRVKAPTNPLKQPITLDSLFEHYEMPGRRMNPYRGWEIYPAGLYDIAIKIKEQYGNIPWFVSENGMGVEGEERFINEAGRIDDDYRIEFMEEHLSYLHQGISEGSNCFGYHTWTGIDCWSWANAYKNRYGFISLNLETMEKTIKKSGYWIKQVTENNGFEAVNINVKDEILNHKDDLVQIVKYLYDHPEIGNQEHKAVKLLTYYLQKHGFKVEAPYIVETGFRAEFDSHKPGRTVAILVEYDALPEIGHGCGHNLISGIGIGAALGIKSELMKTGGKLVVLGTPAEENFGGKVQMVENHAFDDIDFAMMCHPSSKNMLVTPSLAIKALKFEFFGRTSHASSEPEKGINALDAAVLAYQNINMLRQYIPSHARVHGIIRDGGAAANIIPDYASMEYYFRGNNTAFVEELASKAIRCVEAAALATGCKYEVSKYEEQYDNIISNTVLQEVYRQQAQFVGITHFDTSTSAGSTDMGNVSYVVPVIHPYIKMKSGLIAHSTDFADCTVSDEGTNALLNAATILALTALEVLSDQNLFEAIQSEFLEATKQN